jgi:DNA ligase-1
MVATQPYAVQGITTENVDETSLVFVQDVCGVNRERALELFVAGGSVERAVDIHFQGMHQTADESQPKSIGKRKQSSPIARSPAKQVTLSSFFSGKRRDDVQSQSDLNAKHHDATSMDTKQSANQPLSSAIQEKTTSVIKLDDSATDDPRLQYGALAEAFSEMVGTTKRNAKLDSLKKVLTGVVEALGGIGDSSNREEDGDTLCRALQLILGSGIKLQVSGSAVSKAILAVTGASSGKLREAYRRTGDLGDAAEHFVRNQRLLVQPHALSIVSVHNVLQQICSQEGKGSQNQRHTLMAKLLRSCKSNEMKFLVRTLLGNMRLGANVRTVLAALAMSIEELDATQSGRDTNTAAAVKAVQDTFHVCPRLDKISLALLCGGVARMKETCVMEIGTPVNPMLANPAHSFEEVEKLMKAVNGSTRVSVAEWKYDGVRCQAHYNGSTMKLYSRHMLETTDQFPDVVKAILGALKDSATNFILDSEIVGVEESPDEPGVFRLLPFQDLSSRRGDAQRGNPVRICIYVFDLIYVNGESLANKPLWQRQQTLREHFRETVDFSFAQSIQLSSYDEGSVRDFLEVAVKGGAEGLMVKLTGEERSTNGGNNATQDEVTAGSQGVFICPYESGVRSQTWLKVKRDYVAGFADTIDVVPIGAWYGNGRKAEKKFLSPVLLAVYDEEEDVFRSISRCMSFTDAMYDAMREFYFRGTPYPDGVGIAEDPQAANGSNVAAQVGSGSDNVQDDDNDAVSADEERMNCYPSRPSALVVTNESPPIWFKPMEVFEVSFADLTLSKTHTAAAGMVDPTRGVALRFPRFKRRRPDKRIDQATTTVQIAQLFAKQIKQCKS